MLALSTAACDQGTQHDLRRPGPYVHLVAANVGLDKKLPPDGAIRLAFDRLLLPATIIRQSFVVVDAFGVVLSPTVQYDPVTRIVTLGNPNVGGAEWLKPEQLYRVVLQIPAGEDDSSGVRAIDRATLDPASSREITFFAGTEFAGPPTTPVMSFCNDVLPIFQRHCSASQCHGESATTRPASGLVLETPAGIVSTAIGQNARRVAETSNTGPRALPTSPGRFFGVDVPLIEPSAPGNSWLMYKLLIAPPPPPGTPESQRTKCDGTPGTAPQPPFDRGVAYAELHEEERSRLSDYVTGNVMPYPPQPGSNNRTENLSDAELQRISTWITQGAPVTNCGTCEP